MKRVVRVSLGEQTKYRETMTNTRIDQLLCPLLERAIFLYGNFHIVHLSKEPLEPTVRVKSSVYESQADRLSRLSRG